MRQTIVLVVCKAKDLTKTVEQAFKAYEETKQPQVVVKKD